MYNRYIPQADGSFHRSRVPEPIPERAEPANASQVVHNPVQKEAPVNNSFVPPKQSRYHSPRNAPPARNQPQYDHSAASVGSFLKGLLPQNFDTEDLMVVLLLLLMSGNSGNDQNAALMTLVIYLFL